MAGGHCKPMVVPNGTQTLGRDEGRGTILKNLAGMRLGNVIPSLL